MPTEKLYKRFWRHSAASPSFDEESDALRAQPKGIQIRLLGYLQEIGRENNLDSWMDHVDPELTYYENKHLLLDIPAVESPFKCDKERQSRWTEAMIEKGNERKEEQKRKREERKEKQAWHKKPPEYQASRSMDSEEEVIKQDISDIGDEEKTHAENSDVLLTEQDTMNLDREEEISTNQINSEKDESEEYILGDEYGYHRISVTIEIVEFLDRMKEEYEWKSRRAPIEAMIWKLKDEFLEDDGKHWDEWEAVMQTSRAYPGNGD